MKGTISKCNYWKRGKTTLAVPVEKLLDLRPRPVGILLRTLRARTLELPSGFWRIWSRTCIWSALSYWSKSILPSLYTRSQHEMCVLHLIRGSADKGFPLDKCIYARVDPLRGLNRDKIEIYIIRGSAWCKSQQASASVQYRLCCGWILSIWFEEIVLMLS
jgi:hypothetical protein